MDIKSWILLVGTLLIVAVICHGFWTAYLARKNSVGMDIETDIPEDDLDAMAALHGELPNGGARVTPTFGFEALIARKPVPQDLFDEASDSLDPLDEQIALDEAVAFAEEGFANASEAQEGNVDAGYEPEQATLDLDTGALEERYAARIAAARGGVENTSETGSSAPLLTDAETAPVPTAQLPPKKLIAPERVVEPRRKQFEPPLPEEMAEIQAQRETEREQAEKEQAALERAEFERAELKRVELAAAAREQAEREAVHKAKVEAQRVARMEQEQREAQAQVDAQARAEAKAQARARAEKQAQEQALADQQRRAQALQARQDAEAAAAALQTSPPEQFSLSEPVVEFAESSRSATNRRATTAQTPVQAPVEELVVLNVIAKTRAFHGGDVLELFLRNGIKFGDMNIFHRIDPVTKASQYSIASLTEPGFFDLKTMEGLEFRGLALFMQLPCVGQPTKVFTDMLTVADKLGRQLDAEVCDEQFNRLTRQSTEHYRQRVAEFTRRHMSRRA